MTFHCIFSFYYYLEEENPRIELREAEEGERRGFNLKTKRYGRFSDLAVVDGRVRNVSSSLNGTDNSVSVTIPHFWDFVGWFSPSFYSLSPFSLVRRISLPSSPPPLPLVSYFVVELDPDFAVLLGDTNRVGCDGLHATQGGGGGGVNKKVLEIVIPVVVGLLIICTILVFSWGRYIFYLLYRIFSNFLYNINIIFGFRFSIFDIPYSILDMDVRYSLFDIFRFLQ
jgi:hypothetical protein